MKGMKVQNGWKDIEHTIPNYVYINKIDVIYSNDNSILNHKKNVEIKRTPMGFWMFKDNKKHGYLIASDNVYWLDDRLVVMYVNSGMEK